MSSSGNWSMIARATVSPADAGVEDPDGRQVASSCLRAATAVPAFLCAVRAPCVREPDNRYAAKTPAMAPHRWPCQDMPPHAGAPAWRRAGRRRTRTSTTSPTTISQTLRTKNPNTSRNASQPKIRPEAPMCSVGAAAAAHVADQPSAEATENPDDRRRPDESRQSRPASSGSPAPAAGTVLAIRCSQFACSSGAKMMPHRPSVSNGLMPLSSRRCRPSAGR